jgi:hypothetical protein
MPKPLMALMNWNPKRTPKQMRIIVKIFVGMFRISLIANNMINGSRQAYNGPSTGTNRTRKRTDPNASRVSPPFEVLGWLFGLPDAPMVTDLGLDLGLETSVLLSGMISSPI